MLPRLSELFLEWGATDALNLDGGNSSMLIIQDKVVSVKRVDSTTKPRSGDQLKGVSRGRPTPESADQLQRASRGKPIPEKARADRNTKTARGNRRIRPMPKQQGRAIADAILIFSKP